MAGAAKGQKDEKEKEEEEQEKEEGGRVEAGGRGREG
jgi:hypothetical protein